MMQTATLTRMIVLIDVPDTPYLSDIVRLPHARQYEKHHLNIISYIETIRKPHVIQHISIRVTCFNMSMLYFSFVAILFIRCIKNNSIYSVPDEK